MSEPDSHEIRSGRRYLRSLTIAFVLIVVFMVVEAVAAWWTGSLALLSDAGHMATDALGLGMALAAIVVADRDGNHNGRTYGLYRTEILAALANAALLFGVAGYVLFEAVGRFGSPPDILTGPMALVAAVGLGVNIVAWRLLHQGAKESLNVEGAYLEVIADLIGSIGVLVGAIIMWITDWKIIDPIIGSAVGLFILPRAWRLGRKALRILLQAAPDNLNLDALRDRLRDIDGVIDIHDLHVWTLTSEMDVATAHLMIRDTIKPHPVLDEARVVLGEHGIAHATLQVEPESHQGCAEITW